MGQESVHRIITGRDGDRLDAEVMPAPDVVWRIADHEDAVERRRPFLDRKIQRPPSDNCSIPNILCKSARGWKVLGKTVVRQLDQGANSRIPGQEMGPDRRVMSGQMIKDLTNADEDTTPAARQAIGQMLLVPSHESAEPGVVLG